MVVIVLMRIVMIIYAIIFNDYICINNNNDNSNDNDNDNDNVNNNGCNNNSGIYLPYYSN